MIDNQSEVPLKFALDATEVQRTQLGLQLGDVRRSRSISQEAVANELGISRSHVSNIEAGRSRPGWSTLMAMAAYLNVDLQELLDKLIENPMAVPVMTPRTQESSRIAQLGQSMPSQAVVLEALTTLIGVQLDPYETWIIRGLVALPSHTRREMLEELEGKIKSALKGA